MAFKRFSYTKDWKNPLDFPTYEDNEAQVRADMQYQSDEVMVFLNQFLQTLEKEGVDHLTMSSVDAEGATVTITLREAIAAAASTGSGSEGGSESGTVVLPVYVKSVTVDTTNASLQVTYSDGTVKKYALPGYIPQKGVDYFTESDVAEVVSEVLEALPDGDEVSY